MLTFHCLNKLFKWFLKCCKLSAFSLEFQKFFFLITKPIFSNSRSVQFWKQNTISVRKHQKSCFASHFEFVVSYAITITILAYLLHLAKLFITDEILSEKVFLFQNVFKSSQDISKLFIIIKLQNWRKNVVTMLMHRMKIQL